MRNQLREDLRAIALTLTAAVVLVVGGGLVYARDFILKQMRREML